MDEENDWELVTDGLNYACWLSKQGSHFDKLLPFLHWEYSFEARYDFEDIVDSISNSVSRKSWDKELSKLNTKIKIYKDS